MATLVDLLDPGASELDPVLPPSLWPADRERLLAPVGRGREPRPSLDGRGGYVFGVFLPAVALPEADKVAVQEVDLVLTRDTAVVVRKTPSRGAALEPLDVAAGQPAPMLAYRLVDAVAESYLDLLDGLGDEIDELEDNVEKWPEDRIRGRISELRHDLLHIRHTLAPTRDAVRRVVDGRIDLDGDGLFGPEVRQHFGDAYDKLLRASEGLELARDLVAGVRDYHQAKVAQDQNDVMKRLTAIASLLLLPTFIVGLYGQNFIRMPELHWRHGYAWSWFLILATTALQLWYFRRKRWI